MTDEDLTPWTPAGAARLQVAADDLAAAIATHGESLAASTGAAEVFAASDLLLPVVLAYADAQFAFTGTSYPFGALHQYADQEEDDDAVASPPTAGISVLRRHDYEVIDEAAVLSAGRRAYMAAWPDDDEAAAAADVTHVGRALYQVAHSNGWDNLDEVPGLRPTGGCVLVVDRAETLGPDPDSWPKDLFEGAGELQFKQDDVFPG